MNYARSGHGCTIFNSKLHGNRPVVLVFGSLSEDNANTAEILDYTKEDASWEPCKCIQISEIP